MITNGILACGYSYAPEEGEHVEGAGESGVAPAGASGELSAKAAYDRDCVEAAIAIAARSYDITREQVLAPRRCRAWIAEGRQVAMYLAHVIGQVAPTDAAAHFRRDRTTITHACAKIEDRRDDAWFDNGLAGLEAEMLDRVGQLKLQRLEREQTIEAKQAQGGNRPRLVRSANGKFYRFTPYPLPSARDDPEEG